MKAADVFRELRERAVAAMRAHAHAVAEVEELRAKPPNWLVNIGSLYVPPWVGDEEEAIAAGRDFERNVRTRADWEAIGPARRPAPTLGPWRVAAIVYAPDASCFHHPHASRGIRVELTLGCGFPSKPPRLIICSILQHLLDAYTVPSMFYQSLVEARGSEGGCGIAATLEHFRRYLAEPLPGLELERWHASADGNYERLKRIAAYSPLRLHPGLYEAGPGSRGLEAWSKAGLSPGLVTALREGSVGSLVKVVVPGVFTFNMFTDTACDDLLAELENYERVAADQEWRIARPNSMNNYGVIIDNIGLEPWIDALQTDVLRPVASELFPLEGAELTRHHAFLVAYEPGADLGLDMHTDDSDVTFNLCLGKEFSGGGLIFCGQLGKPNHRQFQHAYQHKKGTCLCHLGRHRHGADDVVSGQRRNLIIWNTNPCYRGTREYLGLRPHFFLEYNRESAPPDKLCVSVTHDRDAAEVLGKGKGGANVEAWCPPAGAAFGT